MVVGVSRYVVRYIARKRQDEAKLVKKIHKLAICNGRYGYRRIAVLLRREGWKVNRKRVQAKEMSRAAECIVFANHKGGTGKTTSCLSIGGYLAKSVSKVLVVDFDPQANATSGLGIDTMTLKYSMYDAVLDQCDGYEGVPITEVILETDVENLHVAPSELDLAVAEVLVQDTRNRSGILHRVLEKVRPLYNYILIDLPPGSGLLTINGLCASDQVVVPVDPSIFSLEALDNLKASFRDIKWMEEQLMAEENMASETSSPSHCHWNIKEENIMRLKRSE